ncbi:MAG: transporter [Xanthomonadales bacterium]|nr:transporter [Xanthomonadales bacterium]
MQTQNRFIQMTALALGIAGALAVGQAQASGFQLKENSVKAMGRAFAGSGVATGDASVVVNNPATMTSFEGTTIQSDITVVDLNASFDGGGFAGTGTPLARPLTGGDGGNAGKPTPIPAMSIIHKFDNGLAVGAMISAPIGLKTEWDRGWVGRYQALTSDLKTVDLTLSAAYEIVPDRFSVGAGLVYERAEAELSKAVDFGSLLAFNSVPGFAPQSADGEAVITGDDTGIGYIVGMNFRPTDKLAIGVSHRSEIDHELSGKADWTVPGNARTVFNGIGRSALFNDGKALAKLTTPSVTSVSLSYQFNDQLTFMGDFAQTDWHSLKEIRIEFANPDPDSVEDFSWDDTRFWSVGAEYKLSEAFTLRAGYAYDETPTTFATRTPRLPDEDRRWYSFGLTWNMSEQIEINAAYTRIEPDAPKIGINDSSRHSLFGEFSSDVNLFGISGRYSF